MAKLIGTAGHVDHGKTSLIQALTGIDADRLPEEKERGMTIDIGFAYLDLPPFGRVSIVDVPGHEKFVSNMLVGALGIDVALLCVAADESVKPQTVEHLQILDLLPVEKLVVAMTRCDLADETMRELSQGEVVSLLEGTRFAGAPLVFVSAVTGEGLDSLRAALAESLRASSSPVVDAPWYLPIDRAFSVKGHGCVVTGTLAQGTVRTGDVGYLEPGHVEVRVRALQAHNEDIPQSEEGSRTALNLSGVKLEDVHRGQSIGAPGALFETLRLDAKVRWVQECKHGDLVRVAIGAEDILGRIFLNNEDASVVQLRFDRPVACALGQPLIVRRHSPPDLLCGGKVAVPLALSRRRSEKVSIVEEADDFRAVEEVVSAAPAGVTTEEICRQLGKTAQALGQVFERHLSEETLLGFAGLWFTPELFDTASDAFITALGVLHKAQPMAPWQPREKAADLAKLGWRGKPLDRIVALLVEEGRLASGPAGIRDASFQIQLTDRQRMFLNRVSDELAKESVNTPNAHELSLRLHVPRQAVDEVLKLGVLAGEIVELEDGVLYTPGHFARVRDELKARFGEKPFAASEARDALGTSRKYVIPLLEYLDRQRMTLRVGDKRVVNIKA